MPTELSFLERDLESIIINNLNLVKERGLNCIFYENTSNQFRLKNGKIIDIFSYEIKDDILYCTIMELKKETINSDALMQLHEYLFYLIVEYKGKIKRINYQLVFIGKNYSCGMDYLLFNANNIKLYEYQYNIDGIYFKDCIDTERDNYNILLEKHYNEQKEKYNIK